MSRFVHKTDALSFAKDQCPINWDLGWLDPPYIGIVKQRWDRTFTVTQLLEIVGALAKRAAPTASMVVCQGVGKHGLHPICDVLRGIESLGWTYRNWITWKKRRGYGTQRNYLFTREELLFFSRGDTYTFHPLHTAEKRGYAGWNKAYPAKSEFKRVSNVWIDIPELMRPIAECEKPVALSARVLRAHSNQGDMVIDPFACTGSMGEACAGLGRAYVGCDSDDPKPEGGRMPWAEYADARYRRALESPPSAEALDEYVQPIPDDYEACGDCDFDHMYEPAEARLWHRENGKLGNV